MYIECTGAKSPIIADFPHLYLNLNWNFSSGAFHLVHTHLRGGGVKSPIHFHSVLHAKRGRGGPDNIKIAYVLNGDPYGKTTLKWYTFQSLPLHHMLYESNWP